MAIMDQILGNDFCLGSYAANHMQKGATGQRAHLDYPYSDFNNKLAWVQDPKLGQHNTFHMNMQTVIMLNDFTLENGATACVPFSQQVVAWPDEEEFERNKVQITGKKGTTMVFVGLLQHAARSNYTDKPRTAILGQYLPKYIRPMEDVDFDIPKDSPVRARATKRMQQLLGYHQLHPQSFETHPGVRRWDKYADNNV